MMTTISEAKSEVAQRSITSMKSSLSVPGRCLEHPGYRYGGSEGRNKKSENPVPVLLIFSHVPASNPAQDEWAITFFLEVVENVKNMF